MKLIYLLAFLVIFGLAPNTYCAIVQNDNNIPKGNNFSAGRVGFEESIVLVPDGPCKVNSISIYYSGDKKATDTIWVVGMPTAGNLYPTEYIWDYNTLIDPVIYEYDGVPGWKEINISSAGLKSDGFDKIVIQHIMRSAGPWFTYDSDGMTASKLSWYCDPFTPNPNFYNIEGTLHYYSAGDYLVRLNVEYMYPDAGRSMPPPQPTLVDVTQIAGISGGGEISVADWDGDGFDDIAIGSNFFHNKGDGTFENASSKMNINSGGTSWADFDNDDNLDCYAMANGSTDFDKRMINNNDKIYKNNGDGTFTALNDKDVFALPFPNPSNDFLLPVQTENTTIHNPYNTCSMVWFDYNNDGFSDLFIANKRIEISGKPEIYCPDQLWKNNGNGTFSNIRDSANLKDGEPYRLDATQNSDGSYFGGYYDCYGAAACDYNKDGLADVFVANYRLSPDNLYKNLGNGKFDDVGPETDVRGVPTIAPGYFGHGMGSEWGDFNNDGWPDLCVGNLAHTDSRGQYSNPSLIFRNSGPPDFTFTEVHKQMGLKFHEGNAGVCWLDLNNDGLLDIWHGKYSGGMGSFYLNQGAPDYKLKEITWDANCVMDSPWEGIRLDYDHDGDLDMVIKGRLIRNDLKRAGNWAAFRLSGSPKDKVSNDAFGTKITLYAGGKLFYRELAGSASGTHTNQNSNELHFGIGQNNIIDSMIVRYPNGMSKKYTNVAVNRRYKVPYLQDMTQNGLSAPSLVYPENNMAAPNIFKCTWLESGGAEKYEFVLYTYSTNPQIAKTYIVEAGLSSNLDTFPTGSKLLWKVRAIKGAEKSPWSTMNFFTIGAPLPSIPVLIVPVNGSKKITTKPTMVWKMSNYSDLPYSPFTKYKVQIGIDSSFASPVQSFEDLRDTSVNVTYALTPGVKFFWKVAAITNNTSGSWSEIFSFETQSLPAKPTTIYPESGEKDVILKPTFRWTRAFNADTYQLQVATDSAFSVIVIDKQAITDTSASFFPKLKPSTKYFYHLRSINLGGMSDWSETISFTTVSGGKVDEVQKAILDISVSPNPAKDQFNLDFYQPEAGKLEIKICDLNGRDRIRIFSGNSLEGLKKFNIPTHRLSSGMYMVLIVYNGQTYNEKISIAK